jgi:hypothetical protein
MFLRVNRNPVKLGLYLLLMSIHVRRSKAHQAWAGTWAKNGTDSQSAEHIEGLTLAEEGPTRRRRWPLPARRRRRLAELDFPLRPPRPNARHGAGSVHALSLADAREVAAGARKLLAHTATLSGPPSGSQRPRQ